MFPHRWQWVGLAVAALAIGPAAFAQSSTSSAGAPIPQAAGAFTQKDIQDHLVDWQRRMILPPFQAVAKGQPWEADAVQFCETAFNRLTDLSQANGRELEMLANRGEDLERRCDEPTVRYLTARLHYVLTGDKGRLASEMDPVYRKASSDDRYRRAFVGMIATTLTETLPSAPNDLKQAVVDLTQKAFEEGSFSGKDDSLFVDEVIHDPQLSDKSDEYERMITGLKNLPEWARETILGKIEVARAWNARGDGWADSVTPEGWKGFEKGLEKAHGHLVAAWKLKPDQPYAASELIAVAMGGRVDAGESTRGWFDRAVTACFDYIPAYTAYTWSIQPRWNGSLDEMFAFGKACAATKRYDTRTPYWLIGILDDIGEETKDRRGVFRAPEVADAVMAMDQGYLAEPKRDGTLQHWQFNTLVDAWLCRRWSEGKKSLDALAGQQPTAATLDRLQYYGFRIGNLLGEIELYNSLSKEEYGKARDLDEQEKYAEAAPHYEAALKTSVGLRYGPELIKALIRYNDLRVEFSKDQWTDISPKSGVDPKWQFPRSAYISVPQPGVLQIVGNGETTLATCIMMVGKNYELQADFEFISPSVGRHRFGVQLGHAASSEGVTCQMDYDGKRTGAMVLLRGEFFNTANPKFRLGLQQKNHLHVQCWKGAINLIVNDRPVLQKFVSQEGTPSTHFGMIGFGGYRLTKEDGFRVTNIQIRPLKFAPAKEDEYR